MTVRGKRMALAAMALGCGALAVALLLNVFRSNIMFFLSPTDVVGQQAPNARPFRLGGLVKVGSLQRQADGVTVRFIVTDTIQQVPVLYRGILPDLFREGKGVVTQGRLAADGVFQATEVLAKHDENYMPPEAASALERAGKAQAKSGETRHLTNK